MRRRCPNCKSLDVRRCVSNAPEARASWFRSRFRCRDCKESFRVMNHRAYRLLGFFVRVNAAFFAVIAAVLLVYRS
jgi:transposase-like protein